MLRAICMYATIFVAAPTTFFYGNFPLPGLIEPILDDVEPRASGKGDEVRGSLQNGDISLLVSFHSCGTGDCYVARMLFLLSYILYPGLPSLR